ncbi:MAG: RNA polymerase sigma factor [bacterium]|nr:RNA polymerase sigma factor [bacterium]
MRPRLARVARRLALNTRRSEMRRAHHEERARSERPDGTEEGAAARMELSRGILDHVLALREPYRTTVFLRYHEGLTPQHIARRQSVPVKTVKTRLTRALAELRRKLDGDHGGERERWLGACLPLCLIRRARRGVRYIPPCAVSPVGSSNTFGLLCSRPPKPASGTAPFAPSSGTHRTFTFSPALSARVLRIVIDLSTLGGSSDNVGIDNISINRSAAGSGLGSSYCVRPSPTRRACRAS